MMQQAQREVATIEVGHYHITANIGWYEGNLLEGVTHDPEVIVSQDGGETGTVMPPHMAKALATALRSAAELAESM